MRVLGVLDGNDMPPEKIRAWTASAELVIAADGAADKLLNISVQPSIIIGDMDGMVGDPANLLVLEDKDANFTDCDKLLRWARENGHEELTLINIEGDLLDHVLSTLSSCARFGSVRIALRRGLGWVFSGSLSVPTLPGRRVSLMPLTPCSGVSLSGVQWPLVSAELAMGGLVSISNEATSSVVEVGVRSGSAFLFVEKPDHEMPCW